MQKPLWIVAIVAIVIVVIGAIFFVPGYFQSKPDDVVGVWNGTIQYNKVYYDARLMFYNDSNVTLLFYPKPGLTYNTTQPKTEPIVQEQARWEKIESGYDIVYPAHRVRLDFEGTPHVLRFSEAAREGYQNPYMGYIAKNYNYLKDFGDIYNGEK